MPTRSANIRSAKPRADGKAGLVGRAHGQGNRRSSKTAKAIHDPLQDNIPFLLRRTSRYFRLAMQNRMRQSGLGFSHWFFLRALWLEDSITQRELCKRIGSTEPAAVIALSQLERAGYVRRDRDKKDLRQIRLFVTPKGFDLRDELLPFAIKLIKWSVKDIPNSELETFKSVLHRIEANMVRTLGGRLELPAANLAQEN